MSASNGYGGAWDAAPMPANGLVNPYYEWPKTDTPTYGYTYSYYPFQLSDTDIDRIVDRLIEKLEEIGYEVVKAMRSEEV